MPALLRRKSVVIPVAVIVAGVAAFEGYAAYTRSKPVDYSRGGQVFAAPQPTATPTDEPSGQPSPTAGPTATAAAVPSLLPRTDPVATTGPQATLAPTRPAAAADQEAVLAVPRTGTYQLAVDGSEKVKFGAVSFCNQSLPTKTTLVVAKAAGESKTSYNFDLRYFPGKTGQHDERHIYRYTPSATYLDYEEATVTCQGVRQSSTVSYGPPELRAQLPPTVGDTWHVKSGDSARTETGTGKVLRTETLTIAGEQVKTWVISLDTTLAGDEHGSRSQTWWYSPTWAMPVKWSERINGARSGASYSEDVTVRVTQRP